MKPLITINKDGLQEHTTVKKKTGGAKRGNHEDQCASRFNIVWYSADEAHEAMVEQAYPVRLNSFKEVKRTLSRGYQDESARDR
jgi:hypothetical protein